MAHITTCPACSTCYEELSEEGANDPNRLCLTCFDTASNHPEKCRCELCQKWWRLVPEPEETPT